MNRTKNAKNGIIMGVLNNVIGILLPFISRTIIIYTLGNEYVGLGGLFTSILSVLSLTEMGVGSAISYILYKPIAEEDDDKVCAVLNLYKKIYRIIGGSILIISLAITPFLKNLVAGDVPNGISLYALFAVYVANTAISYFVFGYRRIILSATQRYDVEINLATLTTAIQCILQIIVLVFTKNYYLYVVVLPIATTLNNYLCYFVAKKKYPQYFCAGKIEKSELNIVYKNVGGAFLAKLGSTVYLSVDNIVISAFLGLTVLGVYSNYYYVIASLIAFFAVIHNSLRPVLGNYVATESVYKNWECFKKVDFIYMNLTAICASCCLSLFQTFERIWGGNNNVLPFYMVILLVCYFFFGRSYALLTVYQEAAGILWQGKFIPLTAAILNLMTNIIFVQIVGLPAIVISSIVSILLVSLPGTIHIMFKNYFDIQQKKEYVRLWIIYCIKGVIIIVIPYLVTSRIQGTGVLLLIKQALCCVIIAGILTLLLNCRNENLKVMKGFLLRRKNNF